MFEDKTLRCSIARAHRVSSTVGEGIGWSVLLDQQPQSPDPANARASDCAVQTPGRPGATRIALGRLVDIEVVRKRRIRTSEEELRRVVDR